MKVGIGSDHRGLQQRVWAAGAIRNTGAEPVDFGTHSTESVDYPDIAVEVARAVASGTIQRGVLICGTGIGVSIAANKVAGVRAAVCHDLHTAEMSRRHNDANVLCLPGDALDQHAAPDEAGKALLMQAAAAMRLSARSYTRVLRVARTIADLAGSEGVTRLHVAEALSYRRQAPRG